MRIQDPEDWNAGAAFLTIQFISPAAGKHSADSL